jgi:hypothetical protein
LRSRPSFSSRSGSGSENRPSHIHHSVPAGGLARERPIELGPALCLDLVLEIASDLRHRSRAELLCDQRAGAVAHAVADIVAADDEVLAGVGFAAHEDMDVRVLSVPVVDRYPIEVGAEIPGGLIHEVSRELPQVGQLARVVGRDDEPEVVPVIFAALGEARAVHPVALRIEQLPALAVPGDPVALKVGDVRPKRSWRPSPANDTRLDDRTTRPAEQRARSADAGGTTSAPSRAPTGSDRTGTAGLLGGPKRLLQE